MATPHIGVREIDGAHRLRAIGKRLEEAGAGDLRKELTKGIRRATRPSIRDIRASARSELPESGGLADDIARSRFTTKIRTSGRWAGVRIEARNKVSLRALNKGRLRHPTFGRADSWVDQKVPEGWFTRPVESKKPAIQREVDAVMRDVARKIERK